MSTAAASLHPLSVLDGIEAAARRAPDRVAIDASDGTLTYRDLALAIDGWRTRSDAPRTLRILPSDQRAANLLEVLRAAAAGELPALVPMEEHGHDRAPAAYEGEHAMASEQRAFVCVGGPNRGRGEPVTLSERDILLRALDGAVMHPAITRDTVSALGLPLATPQGMVAALGTLVIGGTLLLLEPGEAGESRAGRALVDAITSGRANQAWLGAEAVEYIAAAPSLAPAPATFRLAICASVPSPTARIRLAAWLSPERLSAETFDERTGVVMRHPGLEPSGEPAIGIFIPKSRDAGPPRRGGLNIIDGIRASALARPDRAAIVIGERTLPYRSLIDRIDRVAAAALADLRLMPGDRVAVVLPNCLEYLEIVCGFAAAGVPAALLPPMAIPSEIRFIVEDSGARVLICHESNEDAARAGAGDLVERIIVVGRDYDDWLGGARPTAALPVIRETDIFSIPYTSGATGRPKGILLSHRSRILSAYALAVEYRALGPDTRMLVSTPVFHGAGFLNLLAPCWFGGQAIILPRFSIEGLLELVARHRINAAHMVPAHFAAYFALAPAVRSRFDTASLRSIVSGTAPLAQAMKERIVESFGTDVLHERYGSTEASIVTNLRPEDQLRKIACVGTPFVMVETEIRDAAGHVLPRGSTGELWSRSPLMFSGYWNRPEAEVAAIRDGWVSAGDLAREDDEGYLYLVDRKNDMIISGGENIFPREVEEVLMRHPAVAEVAVVGLPHDYWGEAVTAFVHLRPETNATAAELERFCSASLARWKVPKAFHLRGPLPRNSMGKILRREVKTQALTGARP